MIAHAPSLHDLPPRLARFSLGIAAFASTLGCDFTSRRCLVAVSGGADSTALLLLARLLCEHGGGSVAAAHLDHALRPESPSDARFVREACEKWRIPLVVERIDVAALAREQGRGPARGLEDVGRQARYAFLERVRRECGAEVILVAHQLNDLAEDQLMRLMRGVGWPGLGGMRAFDPDRFLLRPLLLTPRKALENFLKHCGCSWCTDASNADPATTRNRVRLDVLPALERENPAYLAAAARLWRQARIDADHEEREVAKVLSALPHPQPGEALLLPKGVLEALAPPLRLRVFKGALERLGPGQPLADGLLRLEELWASRATGKRLRFPGDKEARIAKPGLILQVIDRKKDCG